jgi:hypothetical protein
MEVYINTKSSGGVKTNGVLTPVISYDVSKRSALYSTCGEVGTCVATLGVPSLKYFEMVLRAVFFSEALICAYAAALATLFVGVVSQDISALVFA